MVVYGSALAGASVGAVVGAVVAGGAEAAPPQAAKMIAAVASNARIGDRLIVRVIRSPPPGPCAGLSTCMAGLGSSSAHVRPIWPLGCEYRKPSIRNRPRHHLDAGIVWYGSCARGVRLHWQEARHGRVCSDRADPPKRVRPVRPWPRRLGG